MSEYLNQFYNLWILTNLIKVKGTYFIGNFLNGNTRDVDRIIETEGNVISHIYQHISNLVGEPSHIIDNIYLGSAFNVSSLEGLNKFGIEKILNVTKEIPCMFPDSFEYKSIMVKDTRDSFLANHLDEAYQFLTEDPTKQVIVHCYMGSSRSATIVIYYLMKKYKKSYREALKFVKEKRSCVNLNQNFARELENFGDGDDDDDNINGI